jgi:putative PIN family toxin of toxin-antitoxin system
LDDIESLLLKLQYRADLIDVTSVVAVCRNPKDDFLLSLATDGKATHLVTGDSDLLELGKHGDTAIVTMMEYLKGK